MRIPSNLILRLLLACLAVAPYAAVEGISVGSIASLTIIFILLAMFEDQLLFYTIVACIFVMSLLQLVYTIYSGKHIDEYYWIASMATNRSEALSFLYSLSVRDLAIYLGFSAAFISMAVLCARSRSNLLNIGAGISFTFISFAYHLSGGGAFGSALKDVASVFPFYVVSSYQSAITSTQKVITYSNIHAELGGPQVDDIYVFLGESASKSRMSIYGYSRPTTPAIIRQNWIAFRDYIANGLNTQPNLKVLFSGKVLTAKEPLPFDIIRMAKRAGFEVYYLDNNKYQSVDPIYVIGSQANYKSLNGLGETTRETDDAIRHDGLLTPYLEKIVPLPQKKLVIVHLAGSHPSQDKRYPVEFDLFMNAYDNSIYYTDYLVGKWADYILSKSTMRSTVLFMVADHGVKLPPGCGLGQIPEPDYASYGADDRYLSSIEIPFLVNANSMFMDQHPALYAQLLRNTARKIDHTNLLPSLATLMGFTEIEGYALDHSVFAKQFRSHVRLNTEGEDIDALISKGQVCRH